jgi:hypothetical protein
MNLYIENHWLILGLAGLLLAWAGSLTAMHRWARSRALKGFLIAAAGQETRLPPDPNPKDEAAFKVIRDCRNRYLWNWRPDTELSFNGINELSLDLTRKIAGVYYPDEPRPELKASIADLVAMHNRVGARLAEWLEAGPSRVFKEVELRTIIRYYETFQSLKNHSITRFVRRHRLDRLANWSWAAFNYNSPFYWGRRGAYEVGRRLLLARIADLVGEEAVLLYGRRR